MSSDKCLGRADAQQVRERLLADYVNIWEEVFETGSFGGWAYDKRISKLYIHGAPQCGKTTFSAAVAEKLISGDEGQVVSVFLDPDDVFVDDEFVSGGSGVSTRHRFLQTIFQQLPSDDSKDAQSAKLDHLRAMIRTACPPSITTYIIIDGLDRCPTESRHELEDEITSLVHHGCHVMVTNYLGLPKASIVDHTCESCQDENIDHYWSCRDCGNKICDDCAEKQDCEQTGHNIRRHAEADLALVPSDEDIQTFIEHELSLRLAHRDYDEELHELLRTQRERVENIICRKSSRALVVCKALLGYLRDFQKAGYDEIMHLQTGVLRPEEEVFNLLMSKVKSEDSENVKIALLAFSLVSQIPSGSTMTFEDLTNALHRLPAGRTIDEQDLYALCQGMLVIRDRRTIGPFHDDFGVYLQENCAEELRHQGVDLTEMTTDILLDLPNFDSWNDETDRCLSDTISEQPFLGYAAPNWGLHLQQSTAYKDFDEHQSPSPGSLIEKALSLLQSPSKLATCLYVANFYDRTFYLWPGCHALHFCAYYGLTKFIKYFTSGVHSSIDARDPVYGRTPLMVAASKGQTEFARRMIELGADVSLECEDGRSTLLDAVEHDAENQGHYNITKLILQHTTLKKGQTRVLEVTPLIACIRESEHRLFSSQLLNLLIQHPSIDVNEVTLQGHTALLKAVTTEGIEVETIDLLLQHQDLRLDVQDRAGKTALHLAAQCAENDTSVIRRMVNSQHCTPDVLNTRDSRGMTAAMLLLRNEDVVDREEVVDILREMSKAGADFHGDDNNGRGLLHAAVVGEQDLAIDYLVREENLPLDVSDKFGWTPVHYASSIRAPDALYRLLELGANSTRGDARGWSPMDILRCDDQEDDTVQSMRSALKSSSPKDSPPASVPAVLRPAWTFAACKLANFKEMIPEDVRDWWLPDPRRGNLAFHCAVEENNIPVCKLLLEEEETDINAVNAEGNSALFLAIDKYKVFGSEYMAMIKFLLSHGASVKAGGGASGLDALETARQRPYDDLPLVFIEHGGLPLRYGPDFKELFRQAALSGNVSVIEKLQEAQLHPLKRHGSWRLSEIVDGMEAGSVAEEIVEKVKAMQRAALGRIWPRLSE